MYILTSRRLESSEEKYHIINDFMLLVRTDIKIEFEEPKKVCMQLRAYS